MNKDDAKMLKTIKSELPKHDTLYGEDIGRDAIIAMVQNEFAKFSAQVDRIANDNPNVPREAIRIIVSKKRMQKQGLN